MTAPFNSRPASSSVAPCGDGAGREVQLTAYELAVLAREEAEAERRERWREELVEIALHDRRYANGDWSLDDWLEWSSLGRAEAAAFERSTYGMAHRDGLASMERE